MTEEKDYDVVIDVLEKHRDKLWKMTQSNMNTDMMNIMDDIRLEQIKQSLCGNRYHRGSAK